MAAEVIKQNFDHQRKRNRRSTYSVWKACQLRLRVSLDGNRTSRTEQKPDNKPRGVVDTRRWWYECHAIQEHRNVDISDPGARVATAQEIERNRQNSTQYSEIENGMVY